MESYELVFIIEKEDKELIKKIESIITEVGGKVERKDTWGKKSFSYNIGDLIGGYYFLWDVLVDGSNIAKIKEQFNMEDKLVRYLIMKNEN